MSTKKFISLPKNLLGLPTTGRKEWQLHKITLAFKGEIQMYEKDFLNDYFNRSLEPFRFSIVLAIFFYGIFAFLDALMFPELKEIFWFIRFIIITPTLICRENPSLYPRRRFLRNYLSGSTKRRRHERGRKLVRDGTAV